ncbi:hypothetical protein HYC85_026176 [Camellia sinensis]|uniref:Bicarbonate transporter-like transmembrane domain-containing protein n=1 Tax=Camellia sinensis TaxID=4442 RepID=A0A7J7G3E9_CAMSI|nr:hypothetical protein HYC85_026176 [Camellia sinensis]
MQHAVAKELKNLKDAVMKNENGGSKDGNDLEKHIDAHLPVRVNEQKTLLLAMPAIKMIPTSILRGYFAYMALDSLPGNQFCERILLSFLLHLKGGTSKRSCFVCRVDAFQLYCYFAYLLLCFGITWIPIAGILFPTPFFLLIIIKQHLLHKLFRSQYLQELDAAEYEEIAGNRNCSQSMPFKDGDKPLTGNENHEVEISDAEILDELATYR